MIVNSIYSSYYNYNNYQYNRPRENQINFQGQILPQVNFSLKRKHLLAVSMSCLFSSFLLKIFDDVPLEIPSTLQMITNLTNLSIFCIKEKGIQLEKNIEFKKSESIEEAELYAKEKLGIKKYKIDDLEYANWINEGLTNISNRFEGNVYFPEKIKFGKLTNANAAYRNGSSVMIIDKSNIEETASLLKKVIKNIPYDYFTEFNLGKGHEEFCKKLKMAYKNIKSLSTFEKFALCSSIEKISQIREQLEFEDLVKIYFNNDTNYYGCVYPNEFNVIYHEIGHCFSGKNKSLFKRYFNSLRYNSKIAGLKIPNYDKSKIEEYIACTFAGYMQGEKYPEENTRIFDVASKIKFET